MCPPKRQGPVCDIYFNPLNTLYVVTTKCLPPRALAGGSGKHAMSKRTAKVQAGASFLSEVHLAGGMSHLEFSVKY